MKKFLCILILVVMSLTVVAFAAPTDDQLNDLKSLNIMVGDGTGNLRLDDNITRAEATKMICAMFNFELDTFSNDVAPSKFTDVPDSHWAKNYINAMKDYGIIQGDETGKFNPEADVTNEEILKMLVTTIGYAPMADQTGGFPMGYTRTAQKIGLTEGMKLEVDTPATRGDVAQMFATALDIPIMVQTSWSANGDVTYAILDGSAGTELQTMRIRFFGNEDMHN